MGAAIDLDGATPGGERCIAELRGVTKRYANGIVANDDVSLRVRAGRVHAIVGENGAGKSTVMKILYGLERPTAGELRVDGKAVAFDGPGDAIRAGVGLVAQHFAGVPSFTVAQNVVLGREPRKGDGADGGAGAARGWRLDERRAERVVAELGARYGLRVDPAARLETLPVGVRQRVEILKMLYRETRLLLLDEPTAVLTAQETDALFAAVGDLVATGITVVLITHKLHEVEALADHVTVLRAGRVVGDAPLERMGRDEMARLMVGRTISPNAFPRAPARSGSVLLEVDAVSLRDRTGRAIVDGVSLGVASGEIVGIAGVEGNGQTELARVLAGQLTPTSGTVRIDGASYGGLGVRAARELGIAFVPEDRLLEGLAAGMTIADNAIANGYRDPPLSRAGVLRRGRIERAARDLIARFRVAAPGPRARVAALSGGNMQKVLVGREIESRPRALVVSQPTRGVDIAAAAFLRAEIVALRDEGCAIVLVSADLDEILELSDRVLVAYRGRIVAAFPADAAGPHEIGAWMLTGQDRIDPTEARAGVDAREPAP